MRSHACVFIDGENLRYSLIEAFSEERLFRAGEYLPPQADWSGFFDWMVDAATGGNHDRLRAYWFVGEDVDFYPYGLDKLADQSQRERLRGVFSEHKPFREKLRGLKGEALDAEMSRLVANVKATRARVESRFRTWRALQHKIALEHRAIEFRRAGAIRYNLFEERYGQEKCVDVRLACDMIMLRDIYDAAIIVSGDQDYVPATQILKDAGKVVINVAFERRNGKLLPGGARRLNIVTDASFSVPYAKLKTFMRLDPGMPAQAA